MNALSRLAAVLLVTAVPSVAHALNVCVEGAYPPFSEVRDDGQIVGFDIDIAESLCERLGESCGLVQVSWQRMISTLVGGGCDAIVASMSDTAERRQRIDFTTRYYRSPVRFVGRTDAGLDDDPANLAGRIVGVQRGTINQLYMAAHYPATRLRLYGNQEHVLLDLGLGRLDAVLGESVQLDTGFLKTPAGEGFVFFGTEHFDPVIQGEGAAIGVRKGDGALRDRLSQAIADIRADGTYGEISGRYFGTDIYGE